MGEGREEREEGRGEGGKKVRGNPRREEKSEGVGCEHGSRDVMGAQNLKVTPRPQGPILDLPPEKHIKACRLTQGMQQRSENTDIRECCSI